MIPRISIHALREEGDRPAINPRSTSGDFYPRPPRGGRHGAHLRPSCPSNFYPRPPRGGRQIAPGVRVNLNKFLSTPSARRATLLELDGRDGLGISIHALREEGDRFWILCSSIQKQFLSTPSARRATAKTETKSLFSNKLYNILHEFRRALIYNGSKNYPNHAK